jgi:hypothetical protein
MYSQPKKTYFGPFALFTGILAVSSIIANYAVAYMNITPDVFNQLNIWTAQAYCLLTPLAFVLGALGAALKNDFKAVSWIALAVVVIPFLIIFVQFAISLARSNL